MKRLVFFCVVACALALPVGASASTITKVMQGLDNPRGLAFGPGVGSTLPKPDAAGRCQRSVSRIPIPASVFAVTGPRAQSPVTGTEDRNA